MAQRTPRTKRFLGQHFLTDPNYCGQIVGLAGIVPLDFVIEIGPGTGFLTRAILSRTQKVLAIEFDKNLVEYLMQNLQKSYPTELTLIHSDILSIDWNSILPQDPAKLIGNLPYNIATSILTKMIPFRNRIQSFTFMVQKEVAQRILAKPGVKSYGYFTLLMQYHFSRIPGFEVPAGVFTPRPKVRSYVMKLIPHTKVAHLPSYDQFVRLLQTAFSQRRKTLKNNIKDAFGPWKGNLEIAFKRCDIAPIKRPEEVSLQQFVCLARML